MWSSGFFLLSVGILIFEVSSAHADSDGIVRNAEGGIRYMSQYDATTACRSNTRLPTIRELAEESQARGAKGILEVSQVDPNQIPAGYYKISALNPNGQKDEFYFNHAGYEHPVGHPNGDLSNRFWSSSLLSNSSIDAYFLDGGYGVVYSDYRASSFSIAVRCVDAR